MDSEDAVDIVAVKNAFFDHDTAAAAVFLGRLEDQQDPAFEAAGLGEVFCGTKKHRCVAVVAAGVHRAGCLAGVVGSGGFVDRQSVHVGAKPDGGAVPLPLDHCHDAGFGNAGFNLVDADFAQPLFDECRSLRQVETKFGIAMEPVAPFAHFVGQTSDTVQNGHGGLRPLSRDMTEHIGFRRMRFLKMAPRDPIYNVPDGLDRLLEVMRRLRAKDDGCPWDIEQDFSTIAPYTIEEAYEVADAIERADWAGLEGELGDLLFQVVYHGQMGAEAGHFDFGSIARRCATKMIERHPHVFGDERDGRDAEAQTRAWEAAKAEERANRGEAGVLDDVALALPALMRAQKLQKRAARVGFDWPEVDQVLSKIVEEAGELREAPEDKVSEEFGDLLFAVVNLGRHLGIEAEDALRGANAKFMRRFGFIEAELRKVGRHPEDSDLTEMDALWNASKEAERI